MRMRRMPLLLLLAASGTVIAAGCSGGGDDDDDVATVPCAQETRDDDYVAGLEKTGDAGVLRTTLDTADPAPPDVGSNEWTVSVWEVGGTDRVSGCSITATPFMPDHNHGTNPQPAVAELGSSGSYTIAPLNLFMGGLWETTIAMSCGTAGTDTVVYRFCTEG